MQPHTHMGTVGRRGEEAAVGWMDGWGMNEDLGCGAGLKRGGGGGGVRWSHKRFQLCRGTVHPPAAGGLKCCSTNCRRLSTSPCVCSRSRLSCRLVSDNWLTFFSRVSMRRIFLSRQRRAASRLRARFCSSRFSWLVAGSPTLTGREERPPRPVLERLASEGPPLESRIEESLEEGRVGRLLSLSMSEESWPPPVFEELMRIS